MSHKVFRCFFTNSFISRIICSNGRVKQYHKESPCQSWETTNGDLWVTWRLRVQFYVLVDLTVYPAWLDTKPPRAFMLKVRRFIIEKKQRPRFSRLGCPRYSWSIINSNKCGKLPIGCSHILNDCLNHAMNNFRTTYFLHSTLMEAIFLVFLVRNRIVNITEKDFLKLWTSPIYGPKRFVGFTGLSTSPKCRLHQCIYITNHWRSPNHMVASLVRHWI